MTADDVRTIARSRADLPDAAVADPGAVVGRTVSSPSVAERSSPMSVCSGPASRRPPPDPPTPAWFPSVCRTRGSRGSSARATGWTSSPSMRRTTPARPGPPRRPSWRPARRWSW
ncbi:hypothetical protein P9209_26245 [Prescottella defluvii]|nr:hypothetical protein P9209_26245 [Prescottella defluvii]